MSAISCQQRLFGTLNTGQAVTCYTLRNASGMLINVLDYGALLNAVQIPDSRGNMHEMLLGSGSLDTYVTQTHYSGMSLIQSADPTHSLPPLHQSIWQADSSVQADVASVQFSCETAINTHQTLTVKITYTLTAANELIIHSHIEQEKAIPIRITHHPYWNLAGAQQTDVLGHILQVWADDYASVDETGNPSPTLTPIKESAFDFSNPQRLGEKWAQIHPTSHYEVCFLLNLEQNRAQANTTRSLAARVKEPVSGRTLEVYTNQTGLRFSMNRLKESHATPSPLAEAPTPNGFRISTLKLPTPAETSGLPPETVQNTLNQTQETLYKFIW